MGQPHKWQKEIIAWANGEQIQSRWYGGEWTDNQNPAWLIMNGAEYRIKPKDIVVGVRIGLRNGYPLISMRAYLQKPNVELTFDEDTNKLKSVRLI